MAIDDKLRLADQQVRQLTHQVALDRFNVDQAHKKLNALNRAYEVSRRALAQAQQLQSDLMIGLLTCGASHRSIKNLLRRR